MPSVSSCVGSISMSVNPARSSSAPYSANESAPGDAAHVRPALGSVGRREVVVGHHVADAEPAAGPQHAEHLVDHSRLVGRQVDHAVRDDHVDARLGQRDVLDESLQELDVVRARLLGVRAGELEHLVGHVEPVRLAGRADTAGGQQHVDAPARPEVEHRLALRGARRPRWGCRTPCSRARPPRAGPPAASRRTARRRGPVGGDPSQQLDRSAPLSSAARPVATTFAAAA